MSKRNSPDRARTGVKPMLGSIAGDVIGSVFEGSGLKSMAEFLSLWPRRFVNV